MKKSLNDSIFDRHKSIKFLFILVCLDYCYNGGICTIVSGNNPNCTCTASYTGARCQSILTTTSTAPPSTTTDPMCKFMPIDYCKNNASCIIQNGVFACYCPPSYTGKYCELSSGGPGMLSVFF